MRIAVLADIHANILARADGVESGRAAARRAIVRTWPDREPSIDLVATPSDPATAIRRAATLSHAEFASAIASAFMAPAASAAARFEELL